MAGAVFGVASVLVPVYLLPRPLGLAPLGPLELALIALLLGISYIAAGFALGGIQR